VVLHAGAASRDNFSLALRIERRTTRGSDESICGGFLAQRGAPSLTHEGGLDKPTETMVHLATVQANEPCGTDFTGAQLVLPA
jgi:hypothetical protein